MKTNILMAAIYIFPRKRTQDFLFLSFVLKIPFFPNLYPRIGMSQLCTVDCVMYVFCKQIVHVRQEFTTHIETEISFVYLLVESANYFSYRQV